MGQGGFRHWRVQVELERLQNTTRTREAVGHGTLKDLGNHLRQVTYSTYARSSSIVGDLTCAVQCALNSILH